MTDQVELEIAVSDFATAVEFSSGAEVMHSPEETINPVVRLLNRDHVPNKNELNFVHVVGSTFSLHFSPRPQLIQSLHASLVEFAYSPEQLYRVQKRFLV